MGALRLEDIAYNYDDYKLWEGQWELFEGVPVAMSPAPMINHQMISAEILREMGNKIEECSACAVASEIDYKISDDTVLRPDVVLFCQEQDRAYLTKAPEIIVEIISKSTAKRDEGYKFEVYKREKVKYYIIVYPQDLIAKVYKLDGKEYDKQGDFSDESYLFEALKCPFEVDFKKVFKRFK
jgi:Uma2 family endonuclease